MEEKCNANKFDFEQLMMRPLVIISSKVLFVLGNSGQFLGGFGSV